jgi:hypothetical protein
LIFLGREEGARMILNVMLGDDDKKKKDLVARYWEDESLYNEEVNKLDELRCQASCLTLDLPDNE